MGGCFVCGRAGQCGWVFSGWEGGSVGGCLACGRAGQWVGLLFVGGWFSGWVFFVLMGVLCVGGWVSGWVVCVWEGGSVGGCSVCGWVGKWVGVFCFDG